MRNRRSLAVVTLDMAVVALAAVVFLAHHSGITPDGSPQTGIQLFEALALLQFAVILFVTPATMAAAISGERQRRTWDLLRVTHLRPFDIVWAKLLAGLTINVLLLVASIPLFAAVFLFGGVTAADVLHLYTVLLATVLLLGSASLVISVVNARPVASVIASTIVSMFLGFGLSIAILYGEMGDGGTLLLALGALPSGLSPLPWPAQADPLIALLSALPNGHGRSLLGPIGIVHHAFALPLRLQLWEAFCLLAAATTLVLLAVATALIKYGPQRGQSI
jgi:ABC-type transport system involved in multi-copper enzyme maturation permease subunit